MDGRKPLAAVVSLTVALFTAALSHADEGPWQIALGGAYTHFADRSDAIPLLGVPSDAIRTNDSWRADLDAEYFIVRQVSVELALTYPQSQTLRFTQSTFGAEVAGTFKNMPTILTAKYDFIPDGSIRPYLGVGIDWTHFSGVDLAIPNGPLELDRWSAGPAVQAGAEVKLAPHWYANADLEWSKVGSNVDLCCVRVSELHVDPFSIGLGIGYRFGGAR